MSAPGTMLDMDIPFAGIKMTRSDPQKKPNLPWGFSIYRCTFKDDIAWNKMLQLIQQNVQENLELSLPPGEERTELLEAHNLVIHDDPKFDGATSHELQRILQSHSETDLYAGPEYGFGARFNLALFVDDICLESMDYMLDPVVKVMYKQWGDLSPEERSYKIDPEWHDGTTDEWEEDVGWMYMLVAEYVDTYDRFAWTHNAIWFDEYIRPPLMYHQYDEANLPGFWRN